MDTTQNHSAHDLEVSSPEDTIVLGSLGTGDTITLPSFTYSTGEYNSMIGQPFGHGSTTISSSITGGPYGVIGGAQYPNVTVNSGMNFGSTWVGPLTTGTSAKIQLNGEDADVEVNGWSLVDAVKRIEQRLGLYQPNPELESEWSELRELAQRYQQLEQHIQDKQATWDRIRAMPAPDVD